MKIPIIVNIFRGSDLLVGKTTQNADISQLLDLKY